MAEWKTLKIFRKISKISHAVFGLLYILNQKSVIERRDHDRSSQILDSLKLKMIRVCQCDTNYKMAIRSIPDSLFKSLNNLEILHRNWLGVRTPNQLLCNISRVEYRIRELIRGLNWSPLLTYRLQSTG